MKYLIELTPAEVSVLLDVKKSHLELLKITLADLLLKQVLKIFTVERQPNSRDEIRIYKYIEIGTQFKNYKAKYHEKIFLSVFEQDNDVEILFRNLVKIGYQKSSSQSSFVSIISKSPQLHKCFKQNIFQKIFQKYSLTEYGLDLKRKIENEIEAINRSLPNLRPIENEKIIELIKMIGGNILLLKNIDYDILKQIDQDFKIEMNRSGATDFSNGCGGCYFDDYATSFENGFGADAGSGSGCAGCGGCGGCGG